MSDIASYIIDETNEVIQEFGAGVLWWGVKYADYLQPKLMGAAQGYSSRCDYQWRTKGVFLISDSEANPLHQISEIIVGHAVKIYGFKKVEKIAISVMGQSFKQAIKYFGISYFVRNFSNMIVQDITDYFGVESTLSVVAKVGLLGVTSVGVTLNSLQFRSALSYVWLATHHPEICQELTALEIDTFFFLIIEKMKPFLEGKNNELSY